MSEVNNPQSEGSSFGHANLEVLLNRMVVFAAFIRNNENPCIKPVKLVEKPSAEYPLSEFFNSVRDCFLQLPKEHPLRAKYSIKEVARAAETFSEYERGYGLIDPAYILKKEAA